MKPSLGSTKFKILINWKNTSCFKNRNGICYVLCCKYKIVHSLNELLYCYKIYLVKKQNIFWVSEYNN